MSGKFLNPSPSVGAAGTQAKRMWLGIYTASVVSTQDPLKQSRVTLKVPQVLGTSTSNWAVPVGFDPVIPMMNQVVWAMFLGGDINHPLYLYASTTNTTTAVPGLPTVPIINNTTITDSVIDNGTLNNPTITGSNQSITAGTGTSGDDSSGMSLDGGTGSDASGSLNYTTTTGTTVSPVSWSATGADVIGTVTAAAPGASSSVALTSETWHTATLINSWAASSGIVGLKYRLTASNHVEIIADIINTTATGNSTCFVLPSGYIPATGTMNFPAGWNNVASSNSASAPWVNVSNTGSIQITGISVANKEIFFHIFVPLDL